MKQSFWETKTFLKKLRYLLLLQSAANERATSPYKTAQSKANVKTNWIGRTKRTYKKEQTFRFFDDLIWVEEPLINSWFNVPVAQIYIFILLVSASLLFEGVFSLLIPISRLIFEQIILFYLEISCKIKSHKNYWQGRFPGITGNAGNHGNDGKFHEGHKILNQI